VSIASVRGFEFAPDRAAVTVVKVHLSGRDAFEPGRPVFAWTGKLFTEDGVIRLRIEFWAGVGGWSSNKSDRGDSLPGSARVGGSSGGGDGRDNNLPPVSVVSPAQGSGRGPVRARPDPAGGAEAMPVSLAVPAAAPTAASQGGTATRPTSGRAELLANQFIPLASSGSLVTGRMAYELIEGAVPATGQEPDGPVTPNSEEPGGNTPTPPAGGEPSVVESAIVDALSRLPLAGAVPLDLAEVGTSAAEFLDRVVGLDAEWSDDALEFEDYMWTAAAVLLAGAAIHTAASRRSARAPQPFAGLDSVLAEREGDNGRRPG
jgi:hypothetical protein